MAVLSMGIAATFGRDGGLLAFFAMLEFLRACAKGAQEEPGDGSSGPELDRE
ncbi:hypothetical protein [Rhodococcoides yunnanense]|uniref:hypothetical protein n=1 Tax=Rhodococcoides yunnanense TaxID=278209 RepID=UPI0014748D26|nr:hypothetical protein [Rhodococcus yunnanensis]